MNCLGRSEAVRNYLNRMAWAMGVYLLLVCATTVLVRRMGISGWLLYAVALVPCLPVLRILQVVALYLKEEKDEFQRLLVVRAILVGTAVTLGVSTFSDFLRSYTPTGLLPPFTMFVIFWIVFGTAHGILSRMNRVGYDQ
jgi:hypothetical protein